MSCDICTEKYNKAGRKKLDCPECQFMCCFACFKRYTLEMVDEAHCMSCKAALGFEYLVENTPKSFYNTEYRRHRANILLEHQKALLPETQPLVEQRREELARKKQISDLREERARLKARLREITLEERALMRGDEFANLAERELPTKKFVRGCADGDCRGFVGEDWTCGLCQKVTCKRCLELVMEDHECKEENVETARLLKKDTKSCPGCGVPIFRISGCSQMWCTTCHVAFDWNTGKKVSGLIHNPHFAQWNRTQNRPEEAAMNERNRCGYFIPRWVRNDRVKNLSENEKDDVVHMHRQVIHTDQVVMPKYRARDVDEKREYRINYLLNIIDEKKWKTNLQKLEKKNAKNNDIYQLLFAYTRSVGDLYYRLDTGNIDAEELLKQYSKLEKYVNKQFKLIETRYASVPMCIRYGKFILKSQEVWD